MCVSVFFHPVVNVVLQDGGRGCFSFSFFRGRAEFCPEIFSFFLPLRVEKGMTCGEISIVTLFVVCMFIFEISRADLMSR